MHNHLVPAMFLLFSVFDACTTPKIERNIMFKVTILLSMLQKQNLMHETGHQCWLFKSELPLTVDNTLHSLTHTLTSCISTMSFFCKYYCKFRKWLMNLTALVLSMFKARDVVCDFNLDIVAKSYAKSDTLSVRHLF